MKHMFPSFVNTKHSCLRDSLSAISRTTWISQKKTSSALFLFNHKTHILTFHTMEDLEKSGFPMTWKVSSCTVYDTFSEWKKVSYTCAENDNSGQKGRGEKMLIFKACTLNNFCLYFGTNVSLTLNNPVFQL